MMEMPTLLTIKYKVTVLVQEQIIVVAEQTQIMMETAFLRAKIVMIMMPI